MDNVLQSALHGAIIGGAIGLVGGVVMLIIKMTRKQKCPDCGELLPTVGAPKSGQEPMGGGQTCPKCGCQVDRKGKKIGGENS